MLIEVQALMKCCGLVLIFPDAPEEFKSILLTALMILLIKEPEDLTKPDSCLVQALHCCARFQFVLQQVLTGIQQR